MATNQLMILIGCILFVLLVILVIWYSMPRLSKRRRRQLSDIGYYPAAWAGHSVSACLVPSVSIENNTFVNKDGVRIDPRDYLPFVVEGNSMQFCGLNDKDLIFVKKGFRITDILPDGFPYIIVLADSTDPDTLPGYKIRRAWAITTYDRLEEEVSGILKFQGFQNLKTMKDVNGHPAYPGDQAILTDFVRIRVPEYLRHYIECDNPNPWDRTVVLSTTFDTARQFIHFSIHPISHIVGIVQDAFSVSPDLPANS